MLNNWLLNTGTSCSGSKKRIPVFFSTTLIDTDRFSKCFYSQTNKVILKISSNRKHVATLAWNCTFLCRCILRQKTFQNAEVGRVALACPIRIRNWLQSAAYLLTSGFVEYSIKSCNRVLDPEKNSGVVFWLPTKILYCRQMAANVNSGYGDEERWF